MTFEYFAFPCMYWVRDASGVFGHMAEGYESRREARKFLVGWSLHQR
jgi:hypothetical protein